ncbi:hypothetical protein [Paenibacillus dakarensis]|uniref:hypothetical protein n=1 Tax=Paenibacillus dakarensis TaxID=1527293 RepID=UPI0006D52ADF|nr:hypothetical protein [Paenibacillus dakarensis]
MLKFGIAVSLLIFAAAGYLAFRNSRLIAEKKQGAYMNAPAAEYTVYMTKDFTEEDQMAMTPLYMMEAHDQDGRVNVMLCRLKGGARGDLKLTEAGNILIHHIRQAHQKGSFISYRMNKEAWESQEELQMAERIAEAAGKEQAPDLINVK